MSILAGTFPCPLCEETVDVTVDLSTVPLSIDDVPSFTLVAASQYTHTCPPPQGAQDG